MPGLWRNNPETKEGKYLVKRRDGTVPEWPYFVIGAADPAAPFALRAYAERCEKLGMSPDYVNDIYLLAVEFSKWRMEHGAGGPAAPTGRSGDSQGNAEGEGRLIDEGKSEDIRLHC